MIKARNGRVHLREYVRILDYRLRLSVFYDGLNPRVVDDLYETIWHPNLVSDRACIRINLILPLEVQDRCNKIDRRRKNSGQKEADIEAAIIAWAGYNNAKPLHAVFIGPSAVLFFDSKEQAAIAHLFMSDFICDFKEFCSNRF